MPSWSVAAVMRLKPSHVKTVLRPFLTRLAARKADVVRLALREGAGANGRTTRARQRLAVPRS